MDNDDDTSTNAKTTSARLETEMTNDERILPPHILTDDTSEMIGRFFFGPARPGSAVAASKNVGGNTNLDSASFASAYAMITAKGKATRDKQGSNAEENSCYTDEYNGAVDSQGEDVQVTGWDQNEMDLWMNTTEKVETSKNLPIEEKVKDDWISHRRRLLELQKKRSNWDELGPRISITSEMESNRIETPFELHSMDIIEAQRILQATQATRQRIDQQSSDNDTRVRDLSKRKGGGAVIVDDGTQHWMPDSLCKQCYACEASFSLLRRKHHCRLCGMIFW